jgi:hypothetical protein
MTMRGLVRGIIPEASLLFAFALLTTGALDDGREETALEADAVLMMTHKKGEEVFWQKG